MILLLINRNKYAYNYTNAISLEWKPVKGLVLRTEATLSLNWKDQYRFGVLDR